MGLALESVGVRGCVVYNHRYNCGKPAGAPPRQGYGSTEIDDVSNALGEA